MRENDTRSKRQSTQPFIVTLNLLTLELCKNLAELAQTLEQISWNLLGLSEVRRMAECVKAYPKSLFTIKVRRFFFVEEHLNKHTGDPRST